MAEPETSAQLPVEPSATPDAAAAPVAPPPPPAAEAPATPAAEAATTAAAVHATPPTPAASAAEATPAPAAPAAAAPPARPAAVPVIPPGQRDPVKPAAAALQVALATALDGIAYTETVNFGDLEVTLAPYDVYEACRRCKVGASLAFDSLQMVTGTDFETWFEVVYHLYSYRHHHRLTLRTKLDDYEHAALPSVTPLWPAADWHERETAEMLGIDFPGHPHLVPLLLDDDTAERPLRKSHALVQPFADRPGIVMEPGT